MANSENKLDKKTELIVTVVTILGVAGLTALALYLLNYASFDFKYKLDGYYMQTDISNQDAGTFAEVMKFSHSNSGWERYHVERYYTKQSTGSKVSNFLIGTDFNIDQYSNELLTDPFIFYRIYSDAFHFDVDTILGTVTMSYGFQANDDCSELTFSSEAMGDVTFYRCINDDLNLSGTYDVVAPDTESLSSLLNVLGTQLTFDNTYDNMHVTVSNGETMDTLTNAAGISSKYQYLIANDHIMLMISSNDKVTRRLMEFSYDEQADEITIGGLTYKPHV